VLEVHCDEEKRKTILRKVEEQRRTKVTRNYQVSIPAEIRRLLNIKLGDVLEVHCDEEKRKTILRKVEEQRRTLRAGRSLTPEEIEELIQRGLGDNI